MTSTTRPKNHRTRGQYGTQPEPTLPLRDDGSVDTAKMSPPGLRSPHDFGLRAGLRGNPRPLGEMVYLATLVRGATYRFSYAPSPLVFERGIPVPINESEFATLSQQYERVTYTDGSNLMVRHLPVWKFTTTSGEPFKVAPPVDEEVQRQAV